MICSFFKGFKKFKIYKNYINQKIFLSYNKSIFNLVYINKLIIIWKNLNIINSFKTKLLKYFYKINFKLISYYLNIFIMQIDNFINLNIF